MTQGRRWLTTAVLMTASAHQLVLADEAWLQPAPSSQPSDFVPQAIIRRDISVQSLDDKLLTFTVIAPGDSESRQDNSTAIPADRVVWIEPQWDDASIQRALDAFNAGRDTECIPLLVDAITSRPALWKAHWLSMHLWQSTFRAGRYAATLELVNQIDQRPLAPMFLGGLPIHWSRTPLPKVAQDLARAAIMQQDATDAKKLVAASWLSGPSDRAASAQTLEAIAARKDRPALAHLAQMLIVRELPPPDWISQQSNIRKRLDTISMTLTPGPSALLAEIAEAAGDADTALYLHLRTALTPTRPLPVIPDSRLQAERLMRERGQDAESKKLGDSGKTNADATGG